MKIPNYQTKIDRIISKAITSCVASSGIKIAIVTKWMDGYGMFDNIFSKLRASSFGCSLWHEGKRVKFDNGSELYVIDGKDGWKGKSHEFSVIYLVCDMWDLDQEEQDMMKSALAVKWFAEINRIRYPSIDAPRLALRGMTSSMVWFDDDF